MKIMATIMLVICLVVFIAPISWIHPHPRVGEVWCRNAQKGPEGYNKGCYIILYKKEEWVTYEKDGAITSRRIGDFMVFYRPQVNKNTD